MEATSRSRASRTPLRALAFALAAGALAQLGAPALAAQRPDQVYVRERKSGAVGPVSGTVQENTLAKVLLQTSDRPREIDSALVERILFGEVPQAFSDAQNYTEAGDHANAAAQYRLAASDAAARPVVQAAARLRAAQALERSGATDTRAFAEAELEAGRFVSEHADNRELPAARLLQGRATLLAGKPAEAAALLRALYAEGSQAKPTVGYTTALCHEAGLLAADALLAARDASGARNLYQELETSLQAQITAAGAEVPAALVELQQEARLGEGRCLLAAGQIAQAETFFAGVLERATPLEPRLRFGATLGLAELRQAQGKQREAQLDFARVAALDHTSRARQARALLGQAQCALALSDRDARAQARVWLATVQQDFGNTPSILEAQQLLRTL
jgi:hypothetical protein